MSKRRTKKDKEKARHSFAVNWDSGSGTLKFEPDVNRQLNPSTKTKEPLSLKINNPKFSAQTLNLASIRKDITKSLILAGLILASELVIYLIWK